MVERSAFLVFGRDTLFILRLEDFYYQAVKSHCTKTWLFHCFKLLILMVSVIFIEEFCLATSFDHCFLSSHGEHLELFVFIRVSLTGFDYVVGTMIETSFDLV